MAKYNEKNFYVDEQMHINKIEDFLNEDEQILWRAKPKKSAFIWSKILNMLPFALIWLAFDGAFIGLMVSFDLFSSMPVGLIIFLVVFFLLHLTPFWIWLSNVITATVQHKNIEYAFTDKRIIIRTGIIIDIQNIFYMDIQGVNLKVGLIDRMLKVGDIYITTKLNTIVLWDLENPYMIVNKLQKISSDIKADMYFPNALRPEENEGFKTKYKGLKDKK